MDTHCGELLFCAAGSVLVALDAVTDLVSCTTELSEAAVLEGAGVSVGLAIEGAAEVTSEVEPVVEAKIVEESTGVLALVEAELVPASRVLSLLEAELVPASGVLHPLT